jgi:hypothetical protein
MVLARELCWAGGSQGWGAKHRGAFGLGELAKVFSGAFTHSLVPSHPCANCLQCEAHGEKMERDNTSPEHQPQAPPVTPQPRTEAGSFDLIGQNSQEHALPHG